MATNGQSNPTKKITPTNPQLTPTPYGDSPENQPEIWYGLDLDWHPKLRHAVKKVVEWYRREQGALVLMGEPGCGKSHIAKVAYDLFGGPAFVLDWTVTPVESVHNAIFYAEPEMFAEIRQGYGDNKNKGQKIKTEAEIIKSCQRANLFIFDDLGVAHVKDESLPWAYDLYWRIFDARANKFTLVTTNQTQHELALRLGKRALSRLMEAMGNEEGFVDMFGIPDYRQRGWAK